MKTPKERGIEFFRDAMKVNGFDDLSALIIGVLYMEPKEISLEELAQKTGYSLSGISTAMKMLSNMGCIKRLKKPKSKKVYFYMEKDILNSMLQVMKKKYTNILLRAKDEMPEIIKDYKKSDPKSNGLKIVEDYYNMVLDFEGMMLKMIDMMEKMQKKRGEYDK